MTELGVTEDSLKEVVKKALVEVLEERRGYLVDVIEEVLEDFEMIEDCTEVRRSARDGLGAVFSMHEGEA